MKKKDSRKVVKPTQEYESKREQNVLIEEIYSSVKKVAEQVTTMKEEILTEVRTEIGGVKSELETVKMAVMENSRKIDRVETKLDTAIFNHDKRITKLEEKVGV
ncbi:MAG: hypothetical protein KJ893_07300 [Candidatus Omnitrophica bacterium]|nr:hypothetical protein [Candidatus Omnitrophota bacterium]MBU4479671.1 hypothetical protein [Candidatus Omnitrophota bacterium]MCG2703649.1 hypothetical protein [Candidatus Omnitrophota bacterium]